jgi:RsiW-degrading membrane proteinase PrsW (M82 family)
VPEFFESKAGKQLAALITGALVIWSFGLIWHSLIFRPFRRLASETIDVLILTFLVAGLASFIYSVLRIFDLRKEMSRQREHGIKGALDRHA